MARSPTPEHLIPPQAESLGKVRAVVDAVEQRLPILPGAQARHRQYYIQAARVLGLVGDTLSGLGATEMGRRLAQTPLGSADERAVFEVAIRTSTLLRELAPDLLDDPPPSEGELARRMVDFTGQSAATASRRVHTLLAWAQQVKEADAQTGGADPLAPLTSLRLLHFRSFSDATLTLRPLTILVGPNGAGKSNLVDALAFLQEWFKAGGWSSLVGQRPARGRLEHFDHPAFALHVAWGEPAAGSAQIRYSSLDASERVEQLWSADGQQVFAAADRGDGLIVGTHPAGGTTSYETGPALPTLTDDPTAEPLIRTMRALRVYALQPALMRGYHPGKADRLASDGHNLSGVLSHLWPSPENRRALLGLIAHLPEQPIDDLDFLYGPRQEVMVQVVETFGHRRRAVDAAMLSDGTLRALGLGAAILSAPPGAQIVIEDLEDGLHPSRLVALVGRLIALLRERRVRLLVSTHSPALLDAVPDDHLASVIAVFRSEAGDSRLCPLADLATMPALLARRSLGGLLSSGLLERALHDARSDGEVAQQHRAWLERFVQALP